MTTSFVDMLKQKAEDTQHYHFPFSKFRMLDMNTVEVNGSTHGITAGGVESLLDVLDIPKPYAKKCPDDFFLQTVNFWASERKDTYWSLLAEGDNVRAFMKPEYPYIPTYDIWTEVTNALGDGFTVQSKIVKDDVVEVVALSDKYDTKVVDSVVQGGMKFIFSDSWSVFPSFDTYLYRLICSNGMTSPVRGNKLRVSGKSRGEIISVSKEFISKSVLQIPDMIAGLQMLADDEVTNVASTIRRICLENRLPNKIYTILMEWSDRQDFLATIPNHRVQTMHDIINLITYVASHHRDITEDHRDHLFNIGGSAALHHTTRCTSCGSSV